MSNIFEGSSVNEILKDERFLYPDYVPQILPFRDSEIGEMVFALKPATNGKKPTNLFLAGPPGTGKTVSSKHVLSELSEFSDRTKTIYINCFKNNSRHSILAKLTNSLGYPVPLRGISVEEIWDRFVAVIKNKKVTPVIVFDEAEQLLKNDDTKTLLYDLSRFSEQFKLFIGLIFISNDNGFLNFLDDRTRSSLCASTINFEKYSSPQLKEILKERAEFAFYNNVLDDEVIPLAAAHASKTGDARVAIEIFLKAARLAEKENAKKINVTHVRKSFPKDVIIKKELDENLSKQEKMILESINEKDLSAGEIYELFKGDFAERTLRKAISDLESKNLILTKKIQKGKGFTRLISKK
jgi:cell division control protein 6